MKRIFLLERDADVAADLKEFLEDDKTQVDAHNQNSERRKSFLCHLPANYDCHIIHYSMTSEKAVVKLRENNPESLLVIGMSTSYDSLPQPVMDAANMLYGNRRKGMADILPNIEEIKRRLARQ
ncbi:MAG TPA: hypothetical protein VJK03_01090 [Candidatus Nanoarchaeia archaeon]|nr:hypothetical protein [Candidatus Nanoarchaeia archaeon]